MIFAVCFTNFGPYHLARLRALAARLRERGDCLIAYEVAGSERTYPWQRRRQDEPFDWITLFPDRDLETLQPGRLRRGHGPGARPRSARCRGDRRLRPARVDGRGPLGPAKRPAGDPDVREPGDRPAADLVEGADQDAAGSASSTPPWWAGRPSRLPGRARACRPIASPWATTRSTTPSTGTGPTLARPPRRTARACPRPRSSCRSAASSPRRTCVRLIEAFARYRDAGRARPAVGPGPLRRRPRGGPDRARPIARSGHAEAIHRPGSSRPRRCRAGMLTPAAFVLPSLSEPWGLVVNEAASAGLPLLVSERAGCAATLVPEPEGTTGARFDPLDVEEMAQKLTWMACLPEDERRAMGRRAADVVEPLGARPVRARAPSRPSDLARRSATDREDTLRPGTQRGEPMSRHADQSPTTPARSLAGRARLRVAPSLQRPGPGARRGHGPQHPGHDRCLEPARRRRDHRHAHALAARRRCRVDGA